MASSYDHRRLRAAAIKTRNRFTVSKIISVIKDVTGVGFRPDKEGTTLTQS